MQHIWELKVEWDEPLTGEVISQWRYNQHDTDECIKLEIPRYYLNGTFDGHNLHVHIFFDARLKAYGSFGYIVDEETK